jgi:hypothetical protein
MVPAGVEFLINIISMEIEGNYTIRRAGAAAIEGLAGQGSFLVGAMNTLAFNALPKFSEGQSSVPFQKYITSSHYSKMRYL